MFTEGSRRILGFDRVSTFFSLFFSVKQLLFLTFTFQVSLPIVFLFVTLLRKGKCPHYTPTFIVRPDVTSTTAVRGRGPGGLDMSKSLSLYWGVTYSPSFEKTPLLTKVYNDRVVMTLIRLGKTFTTYKILFLKC